MQAYRVEKSIGAVWQTGAALLACVGPQPGAEHVVRSTARLASQLNADWHAVYVETPRAAAPAVGAARADPADPEAGAGSRRHHRRAGRQRYRARNRRLCARPQSFQDRARTRPPPAGSGIRRISGASPATRRISTWWKPAGAMPRRHLRPQWPTPTEASPAAARDRKQRHWGYIWTAAICVAVALAATPLLPYLDLANIVMLFLLVRGAGGGAVRARAGGAGGFPERGWRSTFSSCRRAFRSRSATCNTW